MEQEKRRHKRYTLDKKINGKMVLADKFEIVDISIGGIAIRTDRRLNVGKEYVIRLGSTQKSIDVRGRIIRCELSTVEQGADGEGVTIYTAAMVFQDVLPDTIMEFINSSVQVRKEAQPMTADRRLHVRFYIVASGETTLQFPAEFQVKKISLTGMLIDTDMPLKKESKVPMGLSLKDSEAPVTFTGRVAFCRKTEDPDHYETGVEFTDLTQKDKTVLDTFVEYLNSREPKKNFEATTPS
jgi:Tfp pilus assembly protein PilZ